jgi:hypothetical protein
MMMPRAAPLEHAIQEAQGLLDCSPDEPVNQEYDRGMCELLARTYGGSRPEMDTGEAACEMMVAIRPSFTPEMAKEALYGDGERLWHAFEIMTEGSFILHAYRDPHQADVMFDTISKSLPDAEVDGYIRGTVMALTLQHALDKIRRDKWHSKDDE